MVQIRESATIRRQNGGSDKSRTAEPEKPTETVGVTDERGWPKTDNAALEVNLRLIWSAAKREAAAKTHHRLTLNQAISLASRPVTFDYNVPVDHYRHAVGIVGEVSMTQIQSRLWPNLPTAVGSYNDLAEDAKRSYGIRQRLGVGIRRTLLCVCLSVGGRDRPSTWWIREEVDQVEIPPRSSNGSRTDDVAVEVDNEVNEEISSESNEASSAPQVARPVTGAHSKVVSDVSALISDPVKLTEVIVARLERANQADQLEADNVRLQNLVKDQEAELERLSKIRDLFELMKEEVT